MAEKGIGATSSFGSSGRASISSGSRIGAERGGITMTKSIARTTVGTAGRIDGVRSFSSIASRPARFSFGNTTELKLGKPSIVAETAAKPADFRGFGIIKPNPAIRTIHGIPTRVETFKPRITDTKRTSPKLSEMKTLWQRQPDNNPTRQKRDAIRDILPAKTTNGPEKVTRPLELKGIQKPEWIKPENTQLSIIGKPKVDTKIVQPKVIEANQFKFSQPKGKERIASAQKPTIMIDLTPQRVVRNGREKIVWQMPKNEQDTKTSKRVAILNRLKSCGKSIDELLGIILNPLFEEKEIKKPEELAAEVIKQEVVEQKKQEKAKEAKSNFINFNALPDYILAELKQADLVVKLAKEMSNPVVKQEIQQTALEHLKKVVNKAAAKPNTPEAVKQLQDFLEAGERERQPIYAERDTAAESYREELGKNAIDTAEKIAKQNGNETFDGNMIVSLIPTPYEDTNQKSEIVKDSPDHPDGGLVLARDELAQEKKLTVRTAIAALKRVIDKFPAVRRTLKKPEKPVTQEDIERVYWKPSLLDILAAAIR